MLIQLATILLINIQYSIQKYTTNYVFIVYGLSLGHRCLLVRLLDYIGHCCRLNMATNPLAFLPSRVAYFWRNTRSMVAWKILLISSPEVTQVEQLYFNKGFSAQHTNTSERSAHWNIRRGMNSGGGKGEEQTGTTDTAWSALQIAERGGIRVQGLSL